MHDLRQGTHLLLSLSVLVSSLVHGDIKVPTAECILNMSVGQGMTHNGPSMNVYSSSADYYYNVIIY